MNTQTANKLFSFTFYRFERNGRSITTTIVRNFDDADGLRGIVNSDDKEISTATEKVRKWAESQGLAVSYKEPYPSEKHPGKVWLDFQFGGLTL